MYMQCILTIACTKVLYNLKCDKYLYVHDLCTLYVHVHIIIYVSNRCLLI